MINIQDIIPFMKEGWVAMNASGDWWWFSKEPHQMYSYWWNSESYIDTFDAFDIAPADDWTKSLIKIDNTAREKFEEEYQNNIQRTIQELKQDE